MTEDQSVRFKWAGEDKPRTARTTASRVWRVYVDGTFVGWTWLGRPAYGYGRFDAIWGLVTVDDADNDRVSGTATSRTLAARTLARRAGLEERAS